MSFSIAVHGAEMKKIAMTMNFEKNPDFAGARKGTANHLETYQE